MLGLLTPATFILLSVRFACGRRAQRAEEQRLESSFGSSLNESSESCLDCFLYKSAPHYEENWLHKSGVEQTKARLDENDLDVEDWRTAKDWRSAKDWRTTKDWRTAKDRRTDVERLEDFKVRWSMTTHSIMETLQGQACMDMCAVCAIQPVEQEEKGVPSLKTVHIERNKNELDLGLWFGLGPVDSALGIAVNTIIGLPITLASFFVGGSVTGTVVGGLAGSSATASLSGIGVLGSAAGNLLGALAGLASGAVSGAVYGSLVEIVAIAIGLYKGVDITASLTHCSRVGFERFASGDSLDIGTDRKEQPLRNVAFGPYGLKRLREMIPEEATSDADAEALSHCERIRGHNFDMRHADECLRHSQLCGPQGGLMVPATSPDTCKWISSFDNLYKDAISFVNLTSQSLFSEWTNYEKLVEKLTNKDIKKEMCTSILCELGGLDKAKLDAVADRLPKTEGAESQQKLLLLVVRNMKKFLEGCEVDYGLTECVKEGEDASPDQEQGEGESADQEQGEDEE